jgi:mRNA-degrading endonuclease RelE of RelBE toxin-antitoxin system
MRSKITPEFRKLLRALPNDVREQAYAAYLQFKRDPYHPSLQFKELNKRKKLYSVRIGIKYRALRTREKDDLIVWGWIGSHADYDKRVR